MKIQFKGHSQTDREVELSQQELFNLFEIMREEFEKMAAAGKIQGSHIEALVKLVESGNAC